MTAVVAYEDRRAAIGEYFDRTAADTWRRLTSDEKLGRVRAAVRAGRDRMRLTLLGFLPADMTGLTVLDAGCGTGALASDLAARGARVLAVDLSPQLLAHAAARLPAALAGHVTFRAGDMLEAFAGESIDHVVAMDSLIHYDLPDAVAALAQLAARARTSVLATFVPRTTALAALHAIGRVFPRGDRSPAVSPVPPGALRACLAAEPALADWRVGRSARVSSGFYNSEALELVRR